MAKLYVVGIGPGDYKYLSIEAKEALEDAEVILGYTVYVELVRAMFPKKTFLTTGMRQEEERCRLAYEESIRQGMDGKTVAMICSGDAGVYGMAGLILQMQEEYPQVEPVIIAGITAATAGAAVLGAPLMHDFAVISLSDLMTPWEKIAHRLRLAAESDLVICLYNPSSHKRKDYLKKACQILLSVHRGDIICGIVRNIGRSSAGQEKKIMTLAELAEYPADMFTTVWIGNTQTKEIGKYMVTPRGYQAERNGAMQ